MLFFGKRIVKRLVVLLIGLLALLKLNATFTMFLSMALSVAVYALPFGLWYALGFVILLFVHELGHVIASRAVGVGVKPPIFIPFIGAVVSLKRSPVNAKMAANIAIGGPAMGAISALICIVFYFWTDSILMLVLAYTACILNLFNLIPSDPLDGGKIAMAISPHLWWVGSLIIGGLFFYTYNVLIFLIFLFSLHKLWQGGSDEGDVLYYQLSPKQRLTVLCWYIGLVAVLGSATVYIGEFIQ